MPDDGETSLLSLLPIIGGRSAKLRSARKGSLISEAFGVGVDRYESDAALAQATSVRQDLAKKISVKAAAASITVACPAPILHAARLSLAPSGEAAPR